MSDLYVLTLHTDPASHFVGTSVEEVTNKCGIDNLQSFDCSIRAVVNKGSYSAEDSNYIKNLEKQVSDLQVHNDNQRNIIESARHELSYAIPDHNKGDGTVLLGMIRELISRANRSVDRDIDATIEELGVEVERYKSMLERRENELQNDLRESRGCVQGLVIENANLRKKLIAANIASGRNEKVSSAIKIPMTNREERTTIADAIRRRDSDIHRVEGEFDPHARPFGTPDGIPTEE